MQWIKPEFEEIALCMEVTAYVNTDEQLSVVDQSIKLERMKKASEEETE